MMTAKIFENGRSQAVRLPKEYRFNEREVFVNKIGDVVMIFPKDKEWTGFLASLGNFSDDFFTEGRNQGVSERREDL